MRTRRKSRGNKNGIPPAQLEPWVPYVDLVVVGEIGGECDFFARNAAGVHVPASTLSWQDQLNARAAAVKAMR